MNSFISIAYFAYNYVPIIYTLYTYTSPLTIPLKLSSYFYKRIYPDKKECIIIELKETNKNKDLEDEFENEDFTIISKYKI
jgi:hypothetical protein